MLMKAANAFENKSPSTQAMQGLRVCREMQEWSPLFYHIGFIQVPLPIHRKLYFFHMTKAVYCILNEYFCYF